MRLSGVVMTVTPTTRPKDDKPTTLKEHFHRGDVYPSLFTSCCLVPFTSGWTFVNYVEQTPTESLSGTFSNPGAHNAIKPTSNSPSKPRVQAPCSLLTAVSLLSLP